jgi:hypothetical protein
MQICDKECESRDPLDRVSGPGAVAMGSQDQAELQNPSLPLAVLKQPKKDLTRSPKLND